MFWKEKTEEEKQKIHEGIQKGLAARHEARKAERELAGRIMKYVQDELVVRMPYLNRALLKMPVILYVHGEQRQGIPDGYGTNGTAVYCSAERAVEDFDRNRALLPRIYLHMMMHCLFQHPFRYDLLIPEYWDLAADIAAENAVMNLAWSDLHLEGDSIRQKYIHDLEEKVESLTAENLYHFFCTNPYEARQMSSVGAFFHMDFHQLWLADEEQTDEAVPDEEGRGQDEDWKRAAEEWSRLGRSVRLDLEAFEHRHGDDAGNLTENINEVLQDHVDYTQFLKKFAAMREEIHVNPDEFDYIYYTYGMKLYRNMPLIEPLEYRETRKIRDFVIAIDTSGSVQGRMVHDFLNRTYSILKTTGSFFEKMNVRIIQCDSAIQDEAVITCEKDFERYMQHVEIRGAGGTDFRPVFERVDELIAKREIENLQGVLYFTDGIGTFPSRVPAYRTAFVFLKDGRTRIPEVPPWAIRAVLREEDIEEGTR